MVDHIHRNGAICRTAAVDAAFRVEYGHRLRFTERAFDPENPTLIDLIPAESDEPSRVLFVVDSGVADAWPMLEQQIRSYCEAHSGRISLTGSIVIVPGGERCKNDMAAFESVVGAIHDARLCRHSYVIAISGGAVLDVVGFAAAIAHRGVRLIRMPTTVLAQDDAGIGVKNSINAFGKKNFLGTFAPPWAVINDEVFLTTLSDRDWRCGLSEAVKVALLKDAAYFEQIEQAAAQLRARDESAAMPIIRRCAELHLRHITDGGDPFELTAARPLDFGHWSAHKLEQMTNFDVRHGEAVAIGLAIDSIYSAMIGMMNMDEAQRVLQCLRELGLPTAHEDCRNPALFDGLEEFREHLGGALTITLLRGIGKPVDVHEIDRDVMRKAIEYVLEDAAVYRQAI